MTHVPKVKDCKPPTTVTLHFASVSAVLRNNVPFFGITCLLYYPLLMSLFACT